MSKIFGERLQLLLKKRNISQKDLSEMIDSTEATISRYISGAREPKAEVLADIAKVLNTTSDYLLGIENMDDFNFPKVERILARNASTMTEHEKRALINALFGEV